MTTTLESKINNIICNTIRGGYCSYDKASYAVNEIRKSLGDNVAEISNQIILNTIRGGYCSYDKASYAAKMIAEKFNINSFSNSSLEIENLKSENKSLKVQLEEAILKLESIKFLANQTV